jgi:hypothetical protein
MVDIRCKLSGLGKVLERLIDVEVRLGLNIGTKVHVFVGKTSGRIVYAQKT